ncbi:hypothetical protein ACJROX_10905 [Pseudalkalibacillus sp. A8]|uniref:hypothetical protein n=1 Tax=Pseudalkalibacillus sp. A8 TaxID=3382641 RepID=UPI0038B4CDAD
MDSKINVLRIMSFVVIDNEKDEKRRLLITQELHREKQMKGHRLTMIHKSKVKRFQKWIDEMVSQGLIEPDFFEGQVMVQNDFKYYDPSQDGMKEKLIKEAQNNRFSHLHTEERLMDLSGMVQLEFRFFNKNDNEMNKKRKFVSVDLEKEKTDSYAFNKLLVLEKLQAGEWDLPEPPKTAERYECRLLFEFAPDARGRHGAMIEWYELELAKEGEPIKQMLS